MESTTTPAGPVTVVRTAAPLQWRRLGAGLHEATTADGAVFRAQQDHRPGVGGWKLTRKSRLAGTRTVGTFFTLRSAKIAADTAAAGSPG